MLRVRRCVDCACMWRGCQPASDHQVPEIQTGVSGANFRRWRKSVGRLAPVARSLPFVSSTSTRRIDPHAQIEESRVHVVLWRVSSAPRRRARVTADPFPPSFIRSLTPSVARVAKYVCEVCCSRWVLRYVTNGKSHLRVWLCCSCSRWLVGFGPGLSFGAMLVSSRE